MPSSGHRVRGGDPADELTAHARAVFDEATRCAWINGEPGFINGDQLEDHRTGMARARPVDHDGRGFRSARYQVDAGGAAAGGTDRAGGRVAISPPPPIPAARSRCTSPAATASSPISRRCSACPVPLADVVPGAPPADVAALWDARVEDAVRLGVRFLMRANTMDSLYARGSRAHQPHGHRPDRAARIRLAALRPGVRGSAG